MPSILSPFKPDDGPYQSIGSSIRSLGQSIWGDEAKNEGLRQNALKTQRENQNAEPYARALRDKNIDEMYYRGALSDHNNQDLNAGNLGIAARRAGTNIDDPALGVAQIGAGHPATATMVDQERQRANQRAMEQDRTDRFYPAVIGTDPLTNQPIHGAMKGSTGETRQFGQPTGFNQPGAPQQGAQGAGFRPVADTSPTGEDDGVNHEYFRNLQATNPQMAGHVASILDGREPFPTLGMMRNNPQAVAAYNHAVSVEPGYDATKWFERKRTNDYFSGGGQGSVAAKSANQTIKHMYDMAGYADDLHNKALPGVLAPLSHAYNTAGNNLGKMGNATAPGQFELSHTALSDEIGKLFKSGQLTDTEAKRWSDALPNMGDTPDQQRAKGAAMLTLYKHVVDTLEEQRAKGMSPLARGRVQPLMDQSTADLMRRLEGWSHGQPLAGAPSAKLPQGQAPQGAPQPVVTPQSQAGPGPQGPVNGAPQPPAAPPQQAAPYEGERRQFKQGWGVFHNGQWAPVR